MQEISVSSLVRYLKNKLDNDSNIQKLNVIGEITNYHRHYSGHLYFTLKDENAQINCVMFKSSTLSLKFEPKNGDKVIVNANTSLFESTGQLQLYVQKILPYGLGDLYVKYEELKNKLSQDGYFDDNHKKQLKTKYLNRVAVLVGDKSAAMSDIKTIFARRWPYCNVDYYPVLVQGNDAANNIIEKLLQVDNNNYDLIILARGGGSFEDLFCFNDEKLVKCIYRLKTFIVTGIGHEQDFTLADFVADLRAATPTAAVEIVTPSINEVVEEIDNYHIKLNTIIHNKLNAYLMDYDLLCEKLSNYQNHFILITKEIDSLISKLSNHMKQSVVINNMKIDSIYSNIIKLTNYKLNNKQLLLKRYETLLQAYSSQNVLKRGYTLIKQDDKVIKCKKDLLHKEFDVIFADGRIAAIERN